MCVSVLFQDRHRRIEVGLKDKRKTTSLRSPSQGCFSRKHGEGFFRWVHLSCSHARHYKVSLQGIIIMKVIAKSHCKESLQGVIARSHCKESLQGVIASESHCELRMESSASCKCKESSTSCTTTTPIPAEGSRAPQKSHKKTWVFAPRPRRSPQRVARAPKKTMVFAPRPRRSPQRVARAPQKSQKQSMGFCTSTTPIPAEGRARTEIAKILEFLHLDHADPRRGSREPRAKTIHGFLHLDHADPRRGSREDRRNLKKPWVFAPRPRRSPQRVGFRVVSAALPRRPKKRF